MRIANKVMAIVWTLFFALLLLGSITVISRESQDVFVILFFAVPVALNWLSFACWVHADSRVPQFNLVVAIIYTLFLAAIVVAAMIQKEYGAFVGILIFGPPIAMNYLSYFHWPTRSHLT
jgi:hypothetical protein